MYSRAITKPNMKTAYTIIAIVLIGITGSAIYLMRSDKSADQPASRFTPDQWRARQDAFKSKMEFYKVRIDRNAERETELRREIAATEAPGRVALLMSDLEDLKKDQEKSMKNLSTANEAMLRAETFVSTGRESSLWPETDEVDPDDL